MKKTNICLSDKTCVPCRGGVPPLSKQVVKGLLLELGSGWALNKAGHLYKEYPFTNFQAALSFANQVGTIAEEEGHHPDLKIAWGLCAVEIWTHKINGLTESDFILAAKIEKINEN